MCGGLGLAFVLQADGGVCFCGCDSLRRSSRRIRFSFRFARRPIFHGCFFWRCFEPMFFLLVDGHRRISSEAGVGHSDDDGGSSWRQLPMSFAAGSGCEAVSCGDGIHLPAGGVGHRLCPLWRQWCAGGGCRVVSYGDGGSTSGWYVFRLPGGGVCRRWCQCC